MSLVRLAGSTRSSACCCGQHAAAVVVDQDVGARVAPWAAAGSAPPRWQRAQGRGAQGGEGHNEQR